MSTNKFNVNETLPNHLVDLLGTKKDELNTKAYMYNLLYNNHLSYLINIVTNLFTWKGLGNDLYGNPIKSSFFEYQLALRGSACVAETDKYGLVIVPCTIKGTLNLWGNPNEVQLFSPYGSNSDINSIILRLANGDKFVFCRNDNLSTGFNGLIMQTAKSLTDIFMSILSNANQQKFPVIIEGNKESKITMEILRNKIDAWEEYILIKDSKNFESTDIRTDVINKSLPFVCDKLYQTYQDILNNFFMRIGINMIPNAKKERMLVDEVNANNQAVETAGDIFLNNRLEVCDAVKRTFDLDWTVERNNDFIESLKNIPSPISGTEGSVNFE